MILRKRTAWHEGIYTSGSRFGLEPRLQVKQWLWGYAAQLPDSQPERMPKNKIPQFWTPIPLWCRLWNPELDLRFESAQGCCELKCHDDLDRRRNLSQKAASCLSRPGLRWRRFFMSYPDDSIDCSRASLRMDIGFHYSMNRCVSLSPSLYLSLGAHG